MARSLASTPRPTNSRSQSLPALPAPEGRSPLAKDRFGRRYWAFPCRGLTRPRTASFSSGADLGATAFESATDQSGLRIWCAEKCGESILNCRDSACFVVARSLLVVVFFLCRFVLAGENVFDRDAQFRRVGRDMRLEAGNNFSGAVDNKFGVAPVNLATRWSFLVAGEESVESCLVFAAHRDARKNRKAEVKVAAVTLLNVGIGSSLLPAEIVRGNAQDDESLILVSFLQFIQQCDLVAKDRLARQIDD